MTTMTKARTRIPQQRTYTTPYGRKVTSKAKRRFVVVIEFWSGADPAPVDVLDSKGGTQVVMRTDNLQTAYATVRKVRREVPARHGHSFDLYVFDKVTGGRVS